MTHAAHRALDPEPGQALHAACVAVAEAGVLILGAAGTGKSALSLELMALGARLVADDRTLLDPGAVASAPPALAGLIEARGVGILRAAPVPAVRVALVIDMDETERARLPPPRRIALCGRSLPLLHKVAQGHFPAAIMQYMKGGRHDETAIATVPRESPE